MRFWPQKKWKKIVLVTLLVIIISSISFLVYMSYVINNDVVTQLVIENPTGSKTAIIFYHPGLSSFSYDISDGVFLCCLSIYLSSNFERHNFKPAVTPLYFKKKHRRCNHSTGRILVY